jgi:hypothetical protein
MSQRRDKGAALKYEPDGSPLQIKPLPAPDPVNDAELIATLSGAVLELKAQLAEARARRSAPEIDDAGPEFPPVETYVLEGTVVADSAAAPAAKPIVLRHIGEIVAEKRESQWLLQKIVEKKVLAVVAGPRGTFKSLIALDWSMRMALDGHPGVILSGEGAGLDRRVAAWLNLHRENVEIADIPLYALERPLNLTSIAEMASLCEAIEALHPALEFIVIDTLSKFATGLDENDNGKMATFLSALSGHLREDLGCTVILVAHAGHGDANRPRGASSLMSNPDAEYIVSRPDPRGMTVTVTRERFKDSPALPPLAYEAKVIDLGRLDQYGEPVTSLALVTTDAPAPAKRVGKNQEQALTALKEWARVNPTAEHITSLAISDIFKAQNISPKRRKEVLTYLTNIRVLTASIGGFTVDQRML